MRWCGGSFRAANFSPPHLQGQTWNFLPKNIYFGDNFILEGGAKHALSKIAQPMTKISFETRKCDGALSPVSILNYLSL
jgi:hypothetical protein